MSSVVRRSFRLGLFLGSLVTALASSQALLPTDAMAASSAKAKVAVGGFEGNKNADVRNAFIDALKADGGYEVTDAEDVKASTKASAIVEAAKGLGVSAVITGKVSKGYALKLKVSSAADGKVIDEADIKGGSLFKLKKAIGESGVSSISSSLAQFKVEEKKDDDEAKPEGEGKAEGSASVDTSSAGDAKGLSPLDVTAGFRPVHRTFNFHDTLADLRPNDNFVQLPKYELPLGPSVFIDLNWFPASHFARGPAEWLGITAGYEKGFGVQSIYNGPDGEKKLETDSQAFYVGGRFRFPINEHMLGLTATYGQHSFILKGDEGRLPILPDVKYSYFKVGIDGNLRFGNFMAGARIGKRFVGATGSLETQWYKKGVTTQSIEAGVTVGYRVVEMLDVVAGFDWLRYAFTFDPREIPVAYVAGGAVDDYLTGSLGVRFHLPGKGEKAE